MGTIVRSADYLRRLALALLAAGGTPPRAAEIVADHLVSSNLAGHDSHGVRLLRMYLGYIKEGRIQPAAEPVVIRETASSALVDGMRTFGQVTARRAAEVAIEKASQQGVAAVGAVHCNHIGRLGDYTTLAASRGVVMLVTCGGPGGATAPFGGRQPKMDTNPISIGGPTGEQPPFLLDFATSVIAFGKLDIARQTGKPVPPGSLIDKDGNPTTDPNAFEGGGALLTAAGHKGYALAVASAMMAGPLVGARRHPSGYRYPYTCFMLAVDSGLFQPRADFARDFDELLADLRATPPAPGFDEVLSPGEPEARTRARRLRGGVPIPEEIWATLEDLAREWDVALPPAD